MSEGFFLVATVIAKPRRILLATDLTSRCDRALDRASQLASEWDAELVAAHVVDPAHTPQFHVDRSRRRWRRIHDPLERMRWRIRRDLAGDMENMRFILEEGEPAEKLVEIAAREEGDLIVTGAERPEPKERMVVGRNSGRAEGR